MDTRLLMVLPAALALIHAACAQEPAPTTDDVVVAAADHFRSEMTELSLQFDPRIAVSSGEEDWTPELIRRLEEALDATPARRDDVLRCPGGPASCTLSGSEGFVSFTRPEVIGDRAEIHVNYRWPSGTSRQPIGASRHRIELRREGRRWRVTDTQLIGIT